MKAENILKETGVRYTVVKEKDFNKDAVIYYHEEDVKRAINKAMRIAYEFSLSDESRYDGITFNEWMRKK